MHYSVNTSFELIKSDSEMSSNEVSSAIINRMGSILRLDCGEVECLENEGFNNLIKINRYLGMFEMLLGLENT